MAVGSMGNPQRVAAVLVVAAMILVPLLWMGWSLNASSVLAASNREQSETLAALRARLSALTLASNQAQAGAASVFLPGETPAIAGAVLQRLVVETVERAGGRLEESEISRSAGQEEEEPGAVNLRVSFEADIVGLQRIIFELETGAPILMLQAITVDANAAAGSVESENPMLSVVLLVRGYWEA